MVTAQHVIFGLLAAICAIIGTIANTLSLFYFVKTQTCSFKTLTPILFICLNAVDLILCVLMLPVSISNFAAARFKLLNYEAACYTWSILFNVTMRYSIFIIGVMSVTRCIALLLPLHRIKRRIVISVIIIYFFLLTIQEFVPLMYSLDVVYDNVTMMTCSYNLNELFDPLSAEMKAFYFISQVIESLLPLIPILVSCVLSVYQLRKTPAVQLGYTKSDRNNNEATVTIITLTVVYLVFNIPFVLFGVESSVFLFSNGRVDLKAALNISDKAYDILSAVVQLYAITLNSAANPIVYVIRIKRFRMFVIGVLKRKPLLNRVNTRIQSVVYTRALDIT